MTDPPDEDIIIQLIWLAGMAEVAVADLDRRSVSRLARDAVHEILRLRREIESLEARLDELREETHRC
jgi:hypothetical protein